MCSAPSSPARSGIRGIEVEAALLGFEERERARRVLGTCGNDLAADQVSGLTDMVSVASGGHHCLALEADGSVQAWGRNASGQLGNGTATDSTVPVTVSGLTGVAQPTP